MNKEEFTINANFIVLKVEINALKKILNPNQKELFNEEILKQQTVILNNYVDNDILSKKDFKDIFQNSLIKD